MLTAKPTPLQVGIATLVAALRRLRAKVAPGPSLLSNDHLRQLFPTVSEADAEALGPLLAFVNAALAGAVPDSLGAYLRASRLVALIKKDAAGRR